MIKQARIYPPAVSNMDCKLEMYTYMQNMYKNADANPRKHVYIWSMIAKDFEITNMSGSGFETDEWQ